jgi:hypothetical protein
VPLTRKAALACEILFIYVRVRIRMDRSDVRQIVASIRARPYHGTCREVNPAATFEAWRIATRMANAVTRTLNALPTDSRCLVQSLVLLWMLRRRGISATLVIGARREPEFSAHAWIEHGGRPILWPGEFDRGRLVEI